MMKLKQIIRNQKLSNFNYKLVDFISEADEEEVKYRTDTGKPGTMAVSVALKQKPDHPARIAAERLRGAEDKSDKKDAVGDEETKVSIDKEKRDELNDFGGKIG